MPTQVTLPPNNRMVNQANPSGDMDLVSTALSAMQATSWVFPSGDTSGITDAANVMAAFAALPTVGGTASGVIWMAPGLFYFITGNVTINSPQVKIKGVLRWATKIFGVGSGDTIRMLNPTSGGGGFWGGGVEDVVIDGSFGSAGSCGLHIGDMSTIELNVAVQNFTGTGSIGVHFDNTIWWTEQAHAKVWARNCTQHVVFDVSGATTSANSFAYSEFDFLIESQANQDGVVLQNGAYPYHGKMKIRGNFQGSASAVSNAVLRITGTVPGGHPGAGQGSAIYASNLDIQVEVGSFANQPSTIIFGAAATNFIKGCYGIMDFTQGAGSFSPSNLIIQANAGTFWFGGPVIGDANLQPAATFPVPSISAPLIYAKNFVSGSNGNTFTDSGDFFKATLSASITINMAPGGQGGMIPGPQRKTFIFQQAAAGGPFTITWPHSGSPTTSSPTVLWAGGTAPTMTATASATDIYKLETYDGATWYGQAIQNVS